MEDNYNKLDIFPLNIDYSQLMDLRIDFAFKHLFTKSDPRLLISLLNAIFANKKIDRIIKSLTIENPYLEKKSSEDKLSILDIRAVLQDGTTILIEIHMYGLGELKAKTIRSWARVYGEELFTGDKYAVQQPTIIIAFTNGKIESIEKNKKPGEDKFKIHKLCMILDCDDYTIFSDAMELHYIDMKAYARAVNDTGIINIGDAKETMFAKWLSIITQKEINDKTIIEDACKDAEEIKMAVSTLAKQSEDKIIRQAYQRRQDEIYFYMKNMAERDEFKRIAEQENLRAEKEKQRAETAEAELKKEQQRAEKEKQKAEIAEAEIKKLLQELNELRATKA